MANNSEHWNRIFASKSDAELGWYEADFTQTLSLLSHVLIDSGKLHGFIAGNGTSALADILSEQTASLVVNDLSKSALEQVQKRLSSHIDVSYHCHNLAAPFRLERSVDLWIDRAALHFLTAADERRIYFDNVIKNVAPGGWLLFAQFSKTGAKRCAGLDVYQYDTQSLQAELGEQFELIEQKDWVFTNPFGQARPYIYCLFRRKAKA